MTRLAALLLMFAFPAPVRAAGDKAFISALREVLQEDHVDVRDPVWILETSGFKVSEIVGELTRLMPNFDGPTSVEAAYMLGRIGPKAAAAAPALKKVASGTDADARWAAEKALKLITPKK